MCTMGVNSWGSLRLKRYGLVSDIAGFYPAKMQALVSWALASQAHVPLGNGESLLDSLRQESFNRLVSCVDVTRWEKVSRELGVQRTSPAHFGACIPYAFLPFHPQPRLGRAERRLRPGKLLLRLAMRDVLPESVLYRKKSWADAVVSSGWQQVGVRWMHRAIGEITGFCGIEDQALLNSIRYWDRRAPQAAVTGFAFWYHLFGDSALKTEPPSWNGLLTGDVVSREDCAENLVEGFA